MAKKKDKEIEAPPAAAEAELEGVDAVVGPDGVARGEATGDGSGTPLPDADPSTIGPDSVALEEASDLAADAQARLDAASPEEKAKLDELGDVVRPEPKTLDELEAQEHAEAMTDIATRGAPAPRPPCEKCTAERPCSRECWIAAGLPSGQYDEFLADLAKRERRARARMAPDGRTLCVVHTGNYQDDRLYKTGDEVLVPDGELAKLGHCLSPIEE